MKIDCNKRFEKKFGSKPDESFMPNCNDLSELFSPEILKVGNRYYFKQWAPETAPGLNIVHSISGFGALDNTGDEALTNKIHLEDYLKTRDFKKMLDCSVSFVLRVARQLESQFSGEVFKVSLSFRYKTFVARFYKYRQEEAPYLDDNPENYKTEAILVITTGS